MKRFTAVIVGSALFILELFDRALAGTCALCREVLSEGGSKDLINGYYASIILLVTVPLLILAAGARYAWKRYR